MIENNQVAIAVRGVSKSFRIPLDGNSGIKQKILNAFKHKKGHRDFTPLNDISFEIKKGEFFGIVGRNGSGKSTLLKTIAGIYSPDAGYVKVEGLLVPFIELGVGFNPELSGRENVFLNAALLGFSRQETQDMYCEIVDFAELNDFMEEQLKNYSSGMQVRLAFSIAIRAKGDILLLDEVLAVGDSAFQQKCFDYFADLKKEKKTVILVSHSMSAVQKFCDSAVLIDKGLIVYQGSSEEVAKRYEEMFIEERTDQKIKDQNEHRQTDKKKEPVSIDEIKTIQGDDTTVHLKAFKDFTITLNVKADVTIEAAIIGFNIKDEQGNVLSAFSTLSSLGALHLQKGKTTQLSINMQNIFTNGNYTINLAVADNSDGSEKLIYRKRDAHYFSISGVTHHQASLMHPKVEIGVK